MPQAQIQRYAFVVRVWQDESGHVWGQITEPLHDWRQPFGSREELWQVLMERIQASNVTQPPSAKET